MATRLPFTGEFKVVCTYLTKGTLWKSGYHQGIDLVGITNKNVYSVCNGVVERAGWDPTGFGNYVRIKEDGSEKRIFLAHLAKIYVKVGQKVSYASVVGLMGSTGNSTGPHTHVEIRLFKNGKAVKKLNPANYMGIPNQKGTYNSKNYQINAPAQNTNTSAKVQKIFKVKTNIRETPSLSGKAHLYLAGTRVNILAENVANANGYVWDEVYCEKTGRHGYVARTSNRYR